MKLGSKELRDYTPSESELSAIKRQPIYFVLDEVLDTFNIGSIFRLSDALAVSKVYLCGEMEFPPSSRLHRAAVGTELWTPWEKRDTALEVVRELKSQGVLTVAIEQDLRSTPWNLLEPKFPIALVLGHETTGIKKEVLDEVDQIIELPMLGINHSFNVWGSAAVVGYSIIAKLLNS